MAFDTTSNDHETIYVTLKNSTRVTFEGDDLTDTWLAVRNDPNADYGDYFKPGKNRPRLFAYFGNIETTLPL
jgi:hypothetical protein